MVSCSKPMHNFSWRDTVQHPVLEEFRRFVDTSPLIIGSSRHQPIDCASDQSSIQRRIRLRGCVSRWKLLLASAHLPGISNACSFSSSTNCELLHPAILNCGRCDFVPRSASDTEHLLQVEFLQKFCSVHIAQQDLFH